MSSIDLDHWRQKLDQLTDPAITDVLLVQCDIDWLRPHSRELRDEVDEIVAQLAAHRGLGIRRIVLHNLPILVGLPEPDVAALNSAHADWLYRLAACSALIPQDQRSEIQRLIVAHDQPPPAINDCLEVRAGNVWSDPVTADAAFALGSRTGVTPLTPYDVDIDGPFGDADPSVYL